MMDYIKSECYRLVRKKELYLTISITLGLVVAAIGALYFSLRVDANFIYGTNRFLYLNVLTVWPLIILVGLLVNRQLLGNDQVIIKQSVSFGVSRSKIFFTKLCLTLLTFLFLCFIGLLLVLIAGEGLLKTETIWKTQFLIAVFNAIPLVVSGFIFGHTLVILLRNEAISVCITLFIFSSVPSKLIKLLEQEFLKKELVLSECTTRY